MSDDERALVAAIQATPDENTPRLAYADWLDENGTTDQHRARSEWIRMTCDDRSRRTRMPTGMQIRKPGEPAWLLANAARLWPNLMSLGTKRPRHPTELTFSMGHIAFAVPLEVASPRQRGGTKIEPTVIGLTAERGIATAAIVSFLRAAVVAPAVARDEPAVPIRFASVPVRCYERSPRQITINLRPFALRGLAGVWEAIELEPTGTETSPVKALDFDGAHRARSALESVLHAALTKWARARAPES